MGKVRVVWQQTPYTIPLVVAGGALAAFAAYLYRVDSEQRSQGTVLGSALMAVGAEWVLAYALQLSATTLPQKVLWRTVESVGITLLPVIWLGYVLWYTGHDRWLERRVVGAFGAVSAVFVLLQVTNGIHHLVYREFSLVTIDSHLILDITFGPAYLVFFVYAYGLILVSLGLLAGTFYRTRGVFRRQVATLFVFALVPTVTGILYVTGNNPLPGINVAALSNVVTAFAGGISLLRFRWMDVTPVARDSVFEAMEEVVIVVGPAYRIVDLNLSARRTLGDSDGIIGSDVFEYLSELEPALTGATDRTRREIGVTVGGDDRVFDVRVSPLRGVPGSGTGYTVLLHDVTERKRAERRMRQQSDRLERLHGVTRDLAAARSADAIYGIVVAGASDLLGCDEVRIATADDGRFVPRATSDGAVAEADGSVPTDAGVAGHSYSTGRIEIVDDLADTRPAAAAVGDVGGGSGPTGLPPDGESTDSADYRSVLTAPVGDYAVLQAFDAAPDAFGDREHRLVDLLVSHTETGLDRVVVEEELRAERDRLDEFASVVSHDLRNPLNVADGRVRLAADETGNEHLEPAIRSIDEMDELIDDILTLAREGRVVDEPEPVELETVVDRAWMSVETQEASLDVDSDLGSVDADPSRLQELFGNLFRNAVEHGGTDVTVTVGRLDGGFYVADDGPGIPAEKRDEVLQSGVSTAADGTGFGLAIVERIADAHGWDVDVAESDAGGARFEFS